MRGREFGMKEITASIRRRKILSASMDCRKEYLEIYAQCGLVAKVTEASGGSFSQKISYEFMVLTDAGRYHLYCDACDLLCECRSRKSKRRRRLSEVHRGSTPNRLSKKEWHRKVENVSDLGDRCPRAPDLVYKDEQGNTSIRLWVVMDWAPRDLWV